ncbi:MAG TPA: hypothetical protein VEV62_07885 [Parafilimonas sp.]|nr:hypothetical protein [Parafilimonas sp.]
MKNKYYLIAAIILFTACQKGIEPFNDTGTQTGNDIKGTWNFVSLTANTQFISEYTDSGIDYKTIANSNYVSTNNTGKIIFADSAFNSTDIGYYVSSNLAGYEYQNNVLVDSTQLPFSITVDSSNSSGTYKLIGSDSIYFPSGTFISVSDSTSQSQPSGGKISISGNRLTITQLLNKDTTQLITGIPYHTIETGTFNILLQKQ